MRKIVYLALPALFGCLLSCSGNRHLAGKKGAPSADAMNMATSDSAKLVKPRQ